MSYIAPFANKRLQIAEIRLSGSPAANGYFTFHSLIDDTFDTAPTGLNSATLTLPAGNYIFRAFMDITRSSTNDNYVFKWEAGGTLIGVEGRTAIADNIRSDAAEVPHDSTSSISLKLKCTSIEGSAPTLTSESRAFIWRVSN
jgi:hypothetical protein